MDKKRMLDKTQDEITVGDALKLQGIGLAVMLVPVALWVGGMAWWETRSERKFQKELAEKKSKLDE